MKPKKAMVVVALAGMMALAPAAESAGQPPETTISSGPEGATDDPAVSFGFSSDQPGSSFDCRLDGGTWTLREPPAVAGPAHVFDPRWESCTSPMSYLHLADGVHLFEVRATNPTGETDPSPASRSFALDTGVDAVVSANPSQKQPRRRVRVKLRLEAEEEVAIRARGWVALQRARGNGRLRFELGPRDGQLSAGQTRILRLRPQERAEGRKIAAALRRGRKANAKLAVRLTNALGSRIVRRRAVTLEAG